jgi:hypothetical protein
MWPALNLSEKLSAVTGKEQWERCILKKDTNIEGAARRLESRCMMALIWSNYIAVKPALCKSNVRDGRPLPPYVPKPKPFELTAQLEELEKNILSVRHINEPGYAAFAVMQMSTRCIGVDIDRLLRAVRDLVGEMDFTLRMVKADVAQKESELIKQDEKTKAD